MERAHILYSYIHTSDGGEEEANIIVLGMKVRAFFTKENDHLIRQLNAVHRCNQLPPLLAKYFPVVALRVR